MSRQTAFFSGPYDETMDLLEESRRYVATLTHPADVPCPPPVRLQVSFESMRLTARLTQVMAWLLAQKAMHAGEITMRDLASDQYALGAETICRNNDAAEQDEMPERLRRLLRRSFDLYERIARLDAMVRRAVAERDAAEPPVAATIAVAAPAS